MLKVGVSSLLLPGENRGTVLPIVFMLFSG
jgi:hypothetical protein